jgi:hypothetical protein
MFSKICPDVFSKLSRYFAQNIRTTHRHCPYVFPTRKEGAKQANRAQSDLSIVARQIVSIRQAIDLLRLKKLPKSFFINI